MVCVMDPACSDSRLCVTYLSRSLERVLEDAVFTGEIHLGLRKLKDLCFISSYDLSDTVYADLSKNRFSEFPREICSFMALEKLSLYHNIIKSVPNAVNQLRSLTNLNLSRNQLSFLPPSLCTLPSLEVLNLSSNKLISLPQEISQLKHLIDLDLSSNELNVIPREIGQVEKLRYLKLRKNRLIELPKEISNLKLVVLDCSYNNLTRLPITLREMIFLTDFNVECNPLEIPPTVIASKGLLHVMKYMLLEAIKEEKRRGTMNEFEIRSKFGDSVLYQSVKHPSNMSIDFKRHQKIIDFGHTNNSTYLERNGVSGHTTSNGSGVSEERLVENTSVSSSMNLTDEFSKELARQKGEYERRKQHAQSLKHHLIQQYSESDLQRQKLRDHAKQTHAEQFAILERRREDAKRKLMASQWQAPINLNFDKVGFVENGFRSIQNRNSIDVTQPSSSSSESKKSCSSELSSESAKFTSPAKFNENFTDSDNCSTSQEGVSTNTASFNSSEDVPSFTIRRHLQQVQEEIKLLDSLRKTIESVLKISLPDNLSLALSDGVVLCHLVNQIQPIIITSIHVPSLAMPQLSLAKCRRNVENFVEACRKLGIPDNELCCPQDIIEAKHTSKVARTVTLLMKIRQLSPSRSNNIQAAVF